METLTFVEWGSLAATLAAAGVVMGFIAGLFGIGGGGVLVPVLYEVFGVMGIDEAVRMHLSIGTSLAIIIPTSTRSYFSHRASGNVDRHTVGVMVVPVVTGVIVGAMIARVADASVLKAVWAVVGALLAAKFLFGRESWRLGAELPRALWLRLYGHAVGIVSALMSIGGGAFITMMMTLYGKTIHQGVATASAFGPLIAIPGVIGFVWAGWARADCRPGPLAMSACSVRR